MNGFAGVHGDSITASTMLAGVRQLWEDSGTLASTWLLVHVAVAVVDDMDATVGVQAKGFTLIESSNREDSSRLSDVDIGVGVTSAVFLFDPGASFGC